jgi:hypothetical protein
MRLLRPAAVATLLAAAFLAGPPAGAAAGGGLDLTAIRDRVDEGLAEGGTARVVRTYQRLAGVLEPSGDGLVDDLSRLRVVARACGGILAGDAGLRDAASDALDAAEDALRALHTALIGKAGDLSLQSHRDAVLRKGARAIAFEKLGEAKRVYGDEEAAAGLYRRAALGLAAADRLADRLLDRETPDHAVWSIPIQGRGGALLGVTGEPGSNPRVYVVGAADASGPQFLVRHPGAEGWVRVPVAGSGDLWWVSIVPGDGAWASGSDGRVVRYDPATSEIEDRSTGVDAVLYGVWGSGPTDVWAVGGDPEGVGPVPALLHWDGDSWDPATVPAEAEGKVLYKVWGTGPGEVWAVGEGGVILRFDGAEWTAEDSGTGSVLIGVSGPSPVTAVGGGVAALALQRTVAGGWARIPVTGVSPGTGAQTGGTVVSLTGVFVPSTGPAMAVGLSASLVVRGPSGWTGVPGAPVSVKDLHSIWIDDDGNAVMVGGRLSSLTEGQVVAWGKRKLPSSVVPRARFRDGIADMIYLGCAHSACHLPPFNNAGLALDDADTDIANLVGIASTQSPLLRVLPGRPSQSYLWHKLLGTHESVGGTGARMPTIHEPGDAYFGDAEMEQIRGWILDGARDN